MVRQLSQASNFRSVWLLTGSTISFWPVRASLHVYKGNEGGAGGDTILVFAPDGTESTFATDLADPRGLAFDLFGNLFVAELKAAAPGDILKFSRNGGQTVFASGIGRPEGNGGPEFLTFHQLLIP